METPGGNLGHVVAQADGELIVARELGSLVESALPHRVEGGDIEILAEDAGITLFNFCPACGEELDAAAIVAGDMAASDLRCND